MTEKYINRNDLLKKLGTFNWNMMIMRPELFEMVVEKIIHYIFTKIEEFPYIEIENDKCIYGKWIPVSERLPEVGKSVLVISYGRVCFAKLLLTKNNGGYPTFVLQDGLNNPPVLETTAHNEFTENRITHWQYLPEPPKEETDG